MPSKTVRQNTISRKSGKVQPWIPNIEQQTGPVYQAIVDAMEVDIVLGRLAPGAKLPSQRTLASALGVNLTTITRAMHEAEERGLVTGVTGSGTFVAPRVLETRDWAPSALTGARSGFVDLSLNVLPDAAEVELAQALAQWAAGIARRPQECRSFIPYTSSQGFASDRVAAAEWLARRGLDTKPNQIVITSGAQHGLALAIATLTTPGDTVLCEALAYPGLKSAATVAGVHLIPVAIDKDGLAPAAAYDAFRRHKPRAIVSCPTLHNPTGSVLPTERRQEIAKLARRTGLWIIEDDAYGTLAKDAPPPFATLAPERTVYITSLSKNVAPGLRVGYIVVPDANTLKALLGSLHASTWMTAPMLASIASTWIRNGIAHRAELQLRQELTHRRRLTRKILRSVFDQSGENSGNAAAPHVWIPLTDAMTETRAVSTLARSAIAVTGGDAFRVGNTTSYGFRICIGAARSREVLEAALHTILEMLDQECESELSILLNNGSIL